MNNPRGFIPVIYLISVLAMIILVGSFLIIRQGTNPLNPAGANPLSKLSWDKFKLLLTPRVKDCIRSKIGYQGERNLIDSFKGGSGPDNGLINQTENCFPSDTAEGGNASPSGAIPAPGQPILPTADGKPIVFGAQLSVDPAETAALCPFDQQLGVKATTIWLSWGEFEPSRGVYKWTDPAGSGIDDKLSRFAACGVTDIGLHIEVRSPWGTARTTNPKGAGDIDSAPLSTADFTAGLKQLATHLKGRVTHYSIDNESESSFHWGGSVDSYFQTLSAGYGAIKSADPSAVVEASGTGGSSYGLAIGASLLRNNQSSEAIKYVRSYYTDRPVWGMTYTGNDTSSLQSFLNNSTLLANIRYSQWFSGLYNPANIANYDASQVHFYTDWSLLPRVYSWEKDNTAKAGGSPKPIEQWEIGYPVTPNYDPLTHAEDTVKLLAVAAGEGSSRIIYWELADTPTKKGGLSSSPSKDVGLVPCTISGGKIGTNGRTTGADISCSGPNQAGIAFKVTVAKISGAVSLGRVDVRDPNIWIYHFKNNGRDIFVAWSTGSSVLNLSGDLGLTGSVNITDITGAKAIKSGNLSLGVSPLFIE